MPEHPLPLAVQETVDTLRRHELVTPAALFLIGHRPLAFTAGQCCYLLAPAATLLGVSGIRAWGEVLSDPAQTACLADYMTEALRHAA
ncbi:MAG: hypothetical protein H6642_17315 [Caldilineaceae bacterium]|nr:hypothetical protein [Caldilineaceae bacterium]MCB9140104.1 hypothetical protein [Caldilineaceae bacterium]